MLFGDPRRHARRSPELVRGAEAKAVTVIAVTGIRCHGYGMNFEDLTHFELKQGNHKSPSDGLCVMEAVAWFEGEPHSDYPRCVCPAIGHYCRSLNDKLDGDRQKLVSYIPRLVNTLDSRPIFSERFEMLVDSFVAAGGGKMIAERARRRFANCLYPFFAPSFSLAVICDGVVMGHAAPDCFALLDRLLNRGRPSPGFSGPVPPRAGELHQILR